jgi:hypothetical protein
MNPLDSENLAKQIVYVESPVVECFDRICTNRLFSLDICFLLGLVSKESFSHVIFNLRLILI